MRSSTIVLTIGLLTAPLALLANPQPEPMTTGLQQMAQNTIPNTTTTVPNQSINGRPLLDAPVPGPRPGVAPVDRVAGPGSRDLNAGPVNSTPFSAGPTSNMQAGSQATPNGTQGGIATPNLGR